MNHCSHCNASFDGNYCPTCGAPADVSETEKSTKNAKAKKPFYKKTWFIILAVLIAVSAIGGGIAGNKSNENEDTSISQKQESISSKDNADNNSSSTASKDTDTSKTDGKQDTKTKTITFTQTTLIDNDEISVKATSLVPNDLFGYTVKVLLENKSTTTNYSFSVLDATVNGVEADPLFSADVASGKKANEEITISKSVLKKNGIEDFTDIALSFYIHDADDWLADAIVEKTVHIYPYGAENAVKFVREDQATDTVLFDNDDVKAIVTGYENDSIWGYSAKLYLMNKSDKNVMFSISDASVNGFMIDPYFADTVSPQSNRFATVSWSKSQLEDNSITAINDIEFTIRAYDMNDLLGEDLANEEISLHP